VVQVITEESGVSSAKINAKLRAMIQLGISDFGNMPLLNTK
jgi:hypothetical protein